ncbi:MAG: hypothetical protein IT454_01460 [Planctomycetes bacterium]|nr:hypothetical protein [Planctomycetota bacterium]
MKFLRATAVVGLVLACSCSRPADDGALLLSAEVAARSLPPPTEHRLGEGVERENKTKRKRYFEELHRTAPDVEWRAIERANGLAEMARRNALAAGGVQFLQLGTWSEIGSKNQAGRMMCATLSPDGTQVYAGAALGGLWRCDYGGTNWTPLGDSLYGGVHEVVAIPGEFPGDPDVLAISNSSIGLRVTRDNGQSWETPSGLSSVTAIKELRQFADAAHTIVVWAQTNLTVNAPALFASTDYGRSFVKRFQMPTSGLSDAWVPRSGPGAANNVFIVHRGQVRRSSDGGSSFVPLATIDANASDGVITGSEAGSPTLYVALNNNGWKLYRSDDGGASASLVHTPTDFWGELCASTIDPQVVLYGGVEVFRSSNGGALFGKLNSWGAYYSNPLHMLHADTMGLYAWPDTHSSNGEVFFFCMDGGLWRSHASGASPLNWSLDGLGVSQYYSTLTSSSNPNLILAGSQDQGYQRGVYQAPAGAGPSTAFDQLISGDYGHLTSADGTHSWVYSNYPGFTLVQQGQANPSLVAYVDFPAGSQHLWLPPVVADPLNATSYFLCAERLYRFDRVATNSWASSVHSAQDFSAGTANYLTALSFAPSDPQRVYAADDAGKLYVSTDHALSWTPSASTGPNEHYFYGNAIAVHPSNALEAVIGGSGYSASGVKRTTDGGQTWSALTTGLPATLVYDLVYARDGTFDLYAACEAGAYRYDRAGGTWLSIMSTQAPLTLYWSVEAVGTDRIRYGTYGRGIWDYQLPPPAHVATYCTAKMNSQFCVPAIGANGWPATTPGQPFLITCSQVLAQKNGILFYGFQPNAGSYQGGTLCVKSPVRRTATQSSGGSSPCSGVFGYDMNARIQSGSDPLLVVGQSVYCQYWYRDPQDPFTTGLSNALEFTIP